MPLISRFVPRTVRTIIPAALLGVALSLVVGCGQAFVGTAPASNPFVQAGSLNGIVHGGNQPIVNSTVSLYAAGTSGYGSAGGLYAQTTSNNDAYGSFTFTQTTNAGIIGPPGTVTSSFNCPTASVINPNPQMYLVASGGNTQGVGNGSNSAAAFILALGPCSTIGSLSVDLNEVTTVATMAALQQYFNPLTQSLGYPSTTQAAEGFANGFALISNLANIANGTAVTSATQSYTPLGSTNSVSVTVTPEASKIDAIANILAACVNTTSNTSTQCNTLFTDAVPPTAADTSQPSLVYTSIVPASENTLQALYFMLTNPDSAGSANNMNGLFNLASSYAPFQPAYATAPTDWTIAIYYKSSSKCTLSSGTSSTNTFLQGVSDPVVDAAGNVWWVNESTSTTSGGNLFEISPNGTPLTCGLGKVAAGAAGVTIDSNGYIWVASGVLDSNSLYDLLKWNPSAGALDSTWPTTAAQPQGIAADGNGNILYTASTNTSTFDETSGSLNELAGAAVIGATPAAPNQIAALWSNPLWMAVDSSDRTWVAISHVGTVPSGDEAIFDVFPSNLTTGTTYMPGTSNGSYTGFETSNVATPISGGLGTYSPYGIAVGANSVVTANGAGSGSGGGSFAWQLFTPGSATSESTAGTTTSVVNVAQQIGGMCTPRGVAVDGAGNIFAASATAATGNYVTGATTSGDYTINEIDATGAALSSSANSTVYEKVEGGFQKDLSIMPDPPRGPAVDPTGNVWFGFNSTADQGVVELVGQGVPVVTPLSFAAANGTLGTKP